MIEIIGTELNQWDVGRLVQITGIEAKYAHFANKGDSKAVIMDVVDKEAKIPDYLLQTGKPLCVYAVKDGITIESKTFYVKNRERPENYVYEIDQRNYIYELISSAENAVSDASLATESANLAANAANTSAAYAHAATNSANTAAVSANEAARNADAATNEANRVSQELQEARDSGEFTGPGIVILGSYNTEAELIAAHPKGEPGEYYLVGYYLYTWSKKENKWLNVGNIQGTDGYAPVITIASEEALSAALINIYQSMSDGYAKTFRMSITVANLSIGGGIWFVTVCRSTTKYGFAEAVRYGGSGGLFYTNNLQEGTWSGWTNVSPSKFAPSGYGLNNDFKTTANAADFNGYLTNGWYKYLNDAGVTLVPGFVVYYAICRVDSYSTSYVVQTLYPRAYTGCSLQRYYSNGVWSEWGWVNPPLNINVEYRTTELYKGVAVYKKVDANGNILWRRDGESQWHLLSSADYIATATVE